MKIDNLQFPVKKFLVLMGILVVFFTSLITVAAATIEATVIEDGRKYSVQVFSTETEDILSQANIKVSNKDEVERSETNGIVVTVRHAFDVKVNAHGFINQNTAHYGDTVQDVLDDAGIAVGTNDIVTPSLTEMVKEGTKITVTKQVSVTLTADGETRTLIVPEGTVGDLLISEGVILGKDDLVNVSRSEMLTDGMEIVVNRVTYREVTVEEEIPFEIISKPSDTMIKGSTKIETPGVVGSQTAVRKEKLVDGVVVESEVLSATVHKQPVAQVQLEGTRVKPSSYATIEADGTVYDREGREVNYTKVLSGTCTAYTSNGGYTSTGKKAQVGYVAVNPNIIPYGTEMFICSADGKTVYGYAIAADTGGAMMSGRILVDLYYDTAGECMNFGVRNMSVYILE